MRGRGVPMRRLLALGSPLLPRARVPPRDLGLGSLQSGHSESSRTRSSTASSDVPSSASSSRWTRRPRSTVASAPIRSLPPPVAVGSHISAVDTPALVVKLDNLEANIQNMTASIIATAPAVGIRPHVKSHKTLEIAALQMQQERHIGVSCQKVSEAVAMADVVGDILLTSEVVSLPKASRLANLARRGCTVTAVVDSQKSIDVLTAAARAQGVRLGALVDVNIGHGRCGVDSAEEVVRLAEAIGDAEALHFRGIQAYHGLTQHIRQWSKRKAAAKEVADKSRRVVQSLEEAGFPCDIISGGGTGTCIFDAASEVFTEVQPGSYVFNDVDYSRNLDASGMFVSMWKQSLFVACTVLSRNEVAGRVVLDAGLKAVSYDSGPPIACGPWGADAAPVAESGGDEHTILHFPPGVGIPEIGEQVMLVPGHCDPTMNMHDHIVGIRGDVVEEVWSVTARGPGF